MKGSTSPRPTPAHARVLPSLRFTALIKAILVTCLSWLLAWRPTRALIWGRLVLRVWPNFRRA